MGCEVQVSFTTTVDDVVDYMAHAFWKDRNARTYYLAIRFLIPLGCFVAAGVMVKRGSPPLVPALVVLIGIAHLIATPLVFWRRFRRSARRGAEALPPGLLGPTILDLTEATLTHITAASRVEVPWSDVESVEVLGELLTISLGGTLPFLVPRRGFANEADYLVARDYVLAHVGRPSPH
jgi:hypothetical protein